MNGDARYLLTSDSRYHEFFVVSDLTLNTWSAGIHLFSHSVTQSVGFVLYLSSDGRLPRVLLVWFVVF